MPVSILWTMSHYIQLFKMSSLAVVFGSSFLNIKLFPFQQWNFHSQFSFVTCMLRPFTVNFFLPYHTQEIYDVLLRHEFRKLSFPTRHTHRGTLLLPLPIASTPTVFPFPLASCSKLVHLLPVSNFATFSHMLLRLSQSLFLPKPTLVFQTSPECHHL